MVEVYYNLQLAIYIRFAHALQAPCKTTVISTYILVPCRGLGALQGFVNVSELPIYPYRDGYTNGLMSDLDRTLLRI